MASFYVNLAGQTDRETLESVEVTWGTAKDIIEDFLKVQDVVYGQKIGVSFI